MHHDKEVSIQSAKLHNTAPPAVGYLQRSRESSIHKISALPLHFSYGLGQTAPISYKKDVPASFAFSSTLSSFGYPDKPTSQQENDRVDLEQYLYIQKYATDCGKLDKEIDEGSAGDGEQSVNSTNGEITTFLSFDPIVLPPKLSLEEILCATPNYDIASVEGQSYMEGMLLPKQMDIGTNKRKSFSPNVDKSNSPISTHNFPLENVLNPPEFELANVPLSVENRLHNGVANQSVEISFIWTAFIDKINKQIEQISEKAIGELHNVHFTAGDSAQNMAPLFGTHKIQSDADLRNKNRVRIIRPGATRHRRKVNSSKLLLRRNINLKPRKTRNELASLKNRDEFYIKNTNPKLQVMPINDVHRNRINDQIAFGGFNFNGIDIPTNFNFESCLSNDPFNFMSLLSTKRSLKFAGLNYPHFGDILLVHLVMPLQINDSHSLQLITTRPTNNFCQIKSTEKNACSAVQVSIEDKLYARNSGLEQDRRRESVDYTESDEGVNEKYKKTAEYNEAECKQSVFKVDTSKFNLHECKHQFVWREAAEFDEDKVELTLSQKNREEDIKPNNSQGKLPTRHLASSDASSLLHYTSIPSEAAACFDTKDTVFETCVYTETTPLQLNRVTTTNSHLKTSDPHKTALCTPFNSCNVNRMLRTPSMTFGTAERLLSISYEHLLPINVKHEPYERISVELTDGPRRKPLKERQFCKTFPVENDEIESNMPLVDTCPEIMEIIKYQQMSPQSCPKSLVSLPIKSIYHDSTVSDPDLEPVFCNTNDQTRTMLSSVKCTHRNPVKRQNNDVQLSYSSDDADSQACAILGVQDSNHQIYEANVSIQPESIFHELPYQNLIRKPQAKLMPSFISPNIQVMHNFSEEAVIGSEAVETDEVMEIDQNRSLDPLENRSYFVEKSRANCDDYFQDLVEFEPVNYEVADKRRCLIRQNGESIQITEVKQASLWKSPQSDFEGTSKSILHFENAVDLSSSEAKFYSVPNETAPNKSHRYPLDRSNAIHAFSLITSSIESSEQKQHILDYVLPEKLHDSEECFEIHAALHSINLCLEQAKSFNEENQYEVLNPIERACSDDISNLFRLKKIQTALRQNEYIKEELIEYIENEPASLALIRVCLDDAQGFQKHTIDKKCVLYKVSSLLEVFRRFGIKYLNLQRILQTIHYISAQKLYKQPENSFTFAVNYFLIDTMLLKVNSLSLENLSFIFNAEIKFSKSSLITLFDQRGIKQIIVRKCRYDEEKVLANNFDEGICNVIQTEPKNTKIEMDIIPYECIFNTSNKLMAKQNVSSMAYLNDDVYFYFGIPNHPLYNKNNHYVFCGLTRKSHNQYSQQRNAETDQVSNESILNTDGMVDEENCLEEICDRNGDILNLNRRHQQNSNLDEQNIEAFAGFLSSGAIVDAHSEQILENNLNEISIDTVITERPIAPSILISFYTCESNEASVNTCYTKLHFNQKAGESTTEEQCNESTKERADDTCDSGNTNHRLNQNQDEQQLKAISRLFVSSIIDVAIAQELLRNALNVEELITPSVFLPLVDSEAGQTVNVCNNNLKNNIIKKNENNYGCLECLDKDSNFEQSESFCPHKKFLQCRQVKTKLEKLLLHAKSSNFKTLFQESTNFNEIHIINYACNEQNYIMRNATKANLEDRHFRKCIIFQQNNNVGLPSLNTISKNHLLFPAKFQLTIKPFYRELISLRETDNPQCRYILSDQLFRIPIESFFYCRKLIDKTILINPKNNCANSGGQDLALYRIINTPFNVDSQNHYLQLRKELNPSPNSNDNEGSTGSLNYSSNNIFNINTNTHYKNSNNNISNKNNINNNRNSNNSIESGNFSSYISETLIGEQPSIKKITDDRRIFDKDVLKFRDVSQRNESIEPNSKIDDTDIYTELAILLAEQTIKMAITDLDVGNPTNSDKYEGHNKQFGNVLIIPKEASITSIRREKDDQMCSSNEDAISTLSSDFNIYSPRTQDLSAHYYQQSPSSPLKCTPRSTNGRQYLYGSRLDMDISDDDLSNCISSNGVSNIDADTLFNQNSLGTVHDETLSQSEIEHYYVGCAKYRDSLFPFYNNQLSPLEHVSVVGQRRCSLDVENCRLPVTYPSTASYQRLAASRLQQSNAQLERERKRLLTMQAEVRRLSSILLRKHTEKDGDLNTP